jgi:hypothetical protein
LANFLTIFYLINFNTTGTQSGSCREQALATKFH